MAALPDARAGAAMAYDESRGVTVLFGGRGASGWLGDTWEYDGTSWTKRLDAGLEIFSATATRPTPREGATLTYDPDRHVVMLFGGRGWGWVCRNSYQCFFDTRYLSDTWTWDGTSWKPWTVNSPPRREYHVASWDSRTRRIVIFSGECDLGLGYHADAYAWTGSAWVGVAVGPTGPPPRARGAFVGASTSGPAVLLGGSTSPIQALLWNGSGGPAWTDDVWTYDGSQWQLVPSTQQPFLSDDFAATAAWGRVFVYENGLFEFDGSNWFDRGGNEPGDRWEGNMVYDSRRDAVVFFGGTVYHLGGYSLSNETWEVSRS